MCPLAQWPGFALDPMVWIGSRIHVSVFQEACSVLSTRNLQIPEIRYATLVRSTTHVAPPYC
jgi:hypothetical protein